MMIVEYIRNWIYNKELKKQVLYKKHDQALVGIMCDYTNNDNELQEIYKILNQIGYSSEKIVFLLYHNAKGPITSSHAIYTKDDIHWTGFPKSEKVNDFITQHFKSFYYLSTRFDLHQKFILSKIKADFKAGVYSKGIEDMLDLTIDSKNESPSSLLKEILQLITKLKENKNAK